MRNPQVGKRLHAYEYFTVRQGIVELLCNKFYKAVSEKESHRRNFFCSKIKSQEPGKM
jgi:hypothetical protein